MNHLERKYQVWLCIFAVCIAFVLTGSALLPYNGIETDEALVAGPILTPVALAYRIQVFHRDVPIMLMDYVGALKSWLYWPIFHFFKPSPESLRFPVLIIGALTIGLFARLLEQIAGLRAALAGALLLATDTIYLMTSEFDWGPVAIQHLMLLAACLCLLKFSGTGSAKTLAAGFFALGLGLWDKAIFAWVIGGLALATVAIFPKDLLRRLTIRNLAVALAGFLLGAWPLLVFNASHDWRTFRSNASLSAENLEAKAAVLRSTLNGVGLFGYMVNYPSQPVREPETWLERASTQMADFAGQPHYNFQLPALSIALVAGVLLGKTRRATLFALAFMATAWILMALTKNAGGAVHHAVLLWPFPQLVIAIVLAGISRRWARIGLPAAGAALLFLCVTNLLVTNQYLAQLVRYGPSVIWTDAIYPLSNSLRNETGEVFVVDWDIFDSLLLLSDGGLKLHPGFNVSEQDPQMIDHVLASSRGVFITHTPNNQFFPAANQHLENAIATRGYRKELLRVISDGHGRPVFEVYQFVRQ